MKMLGMSSTTILVDHKNYNPGCNFVGSFVADIAESFAVDTAAVGNLIVDNSVDCYCNWHQRHSYSSSHLLELRVQGLMPLLPISKLHNLNQRHCLKLLL